MNDALEEPAETEIPAEPETTTPAPESRRLRICELALVLGVGFLRSSLSSLRDWWNGSSTYVSTTFGELHRIFDAGLAIAVLAYVLYRQGRNLRTLGLTFRASDVAWALPIAFLSHLLTIAVVNLLHAYAVHFPKGPAATTPSGLIWLAILPLAAKEELLVRAYLMTEVSALTGSMPFAVFASIGFQSFYHLYQGTPAFFLHLGGFFAFAVYYATTRRITPVILAHAFYNFWLLASR
ncbi:MAG TPA: CPBP family intramembrane glutamic endopeptidase [Thermoanaerobaculia bacterium]|nr:CPBP family intramembrane glutamic endopeptidase [Thermoanaerobaculia bacterium]